QTTHMRLGLFRRIPLTVSSNRRFSTFLFSDLLPSDALTPAQFWDLVLNAFSKQSHQFRPRHKPRANRNWTFTAHTKERNVIFLHHAQKAEKFNSRHRQIEALKGSERIDKEAGPKAHSRRR